MQCDRNLSRHKSYSHGNLLFAFLEIPNSAWELETMSGTINSPDACCSEAGCCLHVRCIHCTVAGTITFLQCKISMQHGAPPVRHTGCGSLMSLLR